MVLALHNGSGGELINCIMLCSQHQNIPQVNMLQQNTFPVNNMFAISLFASVVNFKTCFIPGAIIYTVL